MNFVEELRWRGMIHDIMPGTEAELAKGMTAGYVGFDPTADSLHIGNMVPIMLLVHFQRCGHKPVALVGGATGRVGDPSGKAQERAMLPVETIQHNLNCQQKQLEKFLDFNCGENSAQIVNNYDWFKDFSFLDFIRDVGKHISINYMLAKDSVKSRMETGMSFTEFTYQLVQGYDFLHLFQHLNCKLQMGGSDQWGNIVTGTELIRRKVSGEAFALTAPLLTKSDGSKFGKSEGGNVWLDAAKTSPYKFYQYWLNVADDDMLKIIRIFSLKSQPEIEALEKEHAEAPHLRILQKALAEELTARVHSPEALEAAMEASNILFGKGTAEALRAISEENLLSVLEGVPQAEVPKDALKQGIEIAEFLSTTTGFLQSKGEANRALKGNAISLNKEKTNLGYTVSLSDLLNDKFVVVQNGKKNFYLVRAI